MLVTINRNVHEQAGAGMPSRRRPTQTRRSKAKSDRRSQLVAAAERLVAERGFLAVRLEDIGAAAGVSGPAIYRHFPNKEALLVELLVGISTRLLAGATSVLETAATPTDALDGLIDFHLDFALGRIGPDPDPGPRPGPSARTGETSGPQGTATVRRDLGGRAAQHRPGTQGRGRPTHGARHLRAAELHTAQPRNRSLPQKQHGHRAPFCAR